VFESKYSKLPDADMEDSDMESLAGTSIAAPSDEEMPATPAEQLSNAVNSELDEVGHS